MLLNVPAWLIPVIVLLVGAGVALYARWKAAHDKADRTPISQND